MRLAGIRPQNLRFAFSPVRECARGIAVLLHPQRHAEQMPWVRDARRRLPRALRTRIDEYRLLFEPKAETFPTLAGVRAGRGFDAELSELRSSLGAYRDAVIRRLAGRRLLTLDELSALRRPRQYRAAAAEYAERYPKARPMLERFVESPAQSLREFCETLGAFHAVVFQPAWQPINARLAADIAMRKSILGRFGAAALLRTLTPELVVIRGRSDVSVEFPHGDVVLQLDARARVTLAPSFFCWPDYEAVVLQTERGVRCTLAYPIPPLTTRASKVDEEGTFGKMCAALGDETRVRIVELLNARALSTRELAGYLGLGEPAVSRHLRELHDAGIVQHQRIGYFVMYSIRRDAVRRLARSLSVLE